MLPQYKALASYIIPKVDVQVSATFTSKPGVNLSGFGTPQQGGAFQANYVVSNATVAPILGRPLAGNAPNITVNIIEPYAQVGERINELDLRFQKILRFGKTRANFGVDIFNVLNAAPALSYNQAFIPNGAWLTPDVDPVGAVREDQRAVRLLSEPTARAAAACPACRARRGAPSSAAPQPLQRFTLLRHYQQPRFLTAPNMGRKVCIRM